MANAPHWNDCSRPDLCRWLEQIQLPDRSCVSPMIDVFHATERSARLSTPRPNTRINGMLVSIQLRKAHSSTSIMSAVPFPLTPKIVYCYCIIAIINKNKRHTRAPALSVLPFTYHGDMHIGHACERMDFAACGRTQYIFHNTNERCAVKYDLCTHIHRSLAGARIRRRENTYTTNKKLCAVKRIYLGHSILVYECVHCAHTQKTWIKRATME